MVAQFAQGRFSIEGHLCNHAELGVQHPSLRFLATHTLKSDQLKIIHGGLHFMNSR
jgi:hypothetical protein